MFDIFASTNETRKVAEIIYNRLKVSDFPVSAHINIVNSLVVRDLAQNFVGFSSFFVFTSVYH